MWSHYANNAAPFIKFGEFPDYFRHR
jgi:hypothetical protein